MTVERLTIVSIIPYKIFPAQLGGEKGIAVFTEYLARKVNITAVTTQNNDPAFAKGYTLINILPDSRIRYINPFLIFTLKKIMNRTRATHLLIEHPYYGWLAALVKWVTGKPWVVHSHNIEYMRSKSIGRWWWKALRAYEGWVYRKADRVFFISEDDRRHAISQLRVPEKKSLEITYGIDQSALPDNMAQSRSAIGERHGIAEDEKILLFNGALYHSTNYDALTVILEKVNPFLVEQTGFRYKILVCGRGLPESFRELRDYADKNVIYAGFVDDILEYFAAADIFLNPILSGGGVKTKAIEALAMNCTVISTALGAMGINQQVCGGKLHVVEEGQWRLFADKIIEVSSINEDTPKAFFDYYYWGNIIDKAISSLEDA